VYTKAALILFSNLASRKSSVTVECLESYKDLIKTATDDLQAHLESIDEKLETIFRRTVTESTSDATELSLIKEERLSTQKCLQICDQLSDHINQIQLTPKRSARSPGPIDSDAIPERFTNEGLQECKNSLALTAARLERHMRDTMDRLVTKSKTGMNSEDDVADLARLQEEWETTRQSVDICSKADNYLKENVSTIENYATGDAIQFMVSTNGKIIHGKNRGLGWRTRQFGGYMSDASVLHLSQGMSTASFQNTGNDGPSSRSNTLSVPDNTVESGPISEFRERYGRGIRLTSKLTPDVTTPSTRSAESGQNSSMMR
jgi:Fungal N-terminal domain of STAND proteins